MLFFHHIAGFFSGAVWGFFGFLLILVGSGFGGFLQGMVCWGSFSYFVLFFVDGDMCFTEEE